MLLQIHIAIVDMLLTSALVNIASSKVGNLFIDQHHIVDATELSSLRRYIMSRFTPKYVCLIYSLQVIYWLICRQCLQTITTLYLTRLLFDTMFTIHPMHTESRMQLCSLRAPLFDLTRSPSTPSPTVLFIWRRLHIPSLLWHLHHSRCFLFELIEI